MIEYERFLPGKLRVDYNWRTRQPALYEVYDLGEKPIVVRPDDYDAQLRAERMPGTLPRGVAKARYAGQILIGDLIEPLLADNEEMALFEIAEKTGKNAASVTKALNRDGRFVRRGRKWISGQQYTLWALRDEGGVGHD